jgi:hypothetical protein
VKPSYSSDTFCIKIVNSKQETTVFREQSDLNKVIFTALSVEIITFEDMENY